MVRNSKSEILNNVKEQSAVSNQHIKIPLNPPLEKGVQRPRKGDLTIWKSKTQKSKCKMRKAKISQKSKVKV